MAEATTETVTEETTTTEADDAQTETDWQAEAEKWKAQSRKNEDRAKENARKAKELDELAKAQMTDNERAIAEARDQARAEALKEAATDRVHDAFRAAASGRSVDVDALLEGLDTNRFLDDEFKPDRDAINAWVDRIAPAKTETKGPLDAVDLGQGSRESTPIGDDAAFLRMLEDITKS